MKTKKILTFSLSGVVILALITFAVRATFRHKVPSFEVPRIDVSIQTSTMQQWLTEVNEPKDPQTIPHVTAAIQQVGQLWQEWHSLVTSGKARIKPWHGEDVSCALWNSEDNKTRIFSAFKPKARRVLDIKKRIYSPDGKVEHFYKLAYYKDSGTLEFCSLDNREVLFFHPNNKISIYSRKLEPAKEGFETWYGIEWDKHGKIIKQGTGSTKAYDPK